MAAGSTSAGHRFTREAQRTAGIQAGRGAAGGVDAVINHLKERDERLCRLLMCLMEDAASRQLVERLKAVGIDIDEIRKCIKEWCSSSFIAGSDTVSALDSQPAANADTQKIFDERASHLSMIAASGDIFPTTPPPVAIARLERRPRPRKREMAPGEHFPSIMPVDEPEAEDRASHTPPVEDERNADGHLGHNTQQRRTRRVRDRDNMFPPVSPEDER